MGEYPVSSISGRSAVLLNEVLLILLIVYRYDSSTGMFVVPSGGDGFYYFSAYFLCTLHFARLSRINKTRLMMERQLVVLPPMPQEVFKIYN